MAVKQRPAKKSPEERKAVLQGEKVKSQERQLKIKLVRSLIGHPQTQREVVKGLGLRKVNSEIILKDCPEIWGMVKKVPHLIRVKVLEKK
jgi:large subunit ribosomal protein L30